MELEGTVSGGLIVPDSGSTPLDEGMRVKIFTPSPDLSTREPRVRSRVSLAELLSDFKGAVDDLPSDYAAQLDHYLHGTSKR